MEYRKNVVGRLGNEEEGCSVSINFSDEFGRER